MTIRMRASRWRSYQRFSLLVLLVLASLSQSTLCEAWEWPDVLAVVGGDNSSSRQQTLTMKEIKEMRVRDIKWRLSRSHGYSHEEVSRMLDKKELIEALSLEEYKVRRIHQEEDRRQLFWSGIVIAVLVGLITFFWPLLVQLYNMMSVNLVVYIDRKRYEWHRCWTELRSGWGCFGLFLLLGLDFLQVWLTASIAASWIMSSSSPYRAYLFPFPSLPVKPAQLLSSDPKISEGPLSSYGINIGPMMTGWLLRFLHSKCENWIAICMKASMKRQRQAQRANETPEERKARKAAKRAAKAAAKQRQQRHYYAPSNDEAFMGPIQESDYPMAAATTNGGDADEGVVQDVTPPQPAGPLSAEERREQTAAAAELRKRRAAVADTVEPSPMDELD